MTTITIELPSTGFESPDADELGKLARIVHAADPAFPDFSEPDAIDEFARAFVAAGYFFRLPAPCTTRYFASILDDANVFLTTRLRWQAIGGRAFLAAIVAASDVPWRRAEPAIGQLLEVGLDPFSGLRTRNRWRGLIDGTANLIAPTPPPPALRRTLAEQNSVRVFEQHRPGEPWQDRSAADGPLWQ
jgi:hypothetical protein